MADRTPQWHLYDIHRRHVWQCATTGSDMRGMVDQRRPRGYFRIWHSGTGEYWERKGGKWLPLAAAETKVPA